MNEIFTAPHSPEWAVAIIEEIREFQERKPKSFKEPDADPLLHTWNPQKINIAAKIVLPEEIRGILALVERFLRRNDLNDLKGSIEFFEVQRVFLGNIFDQKLQIILRIHPQMHRELQFVLSPIPAGLRKMSEKVQGNPYCLEGHGVEEAMWNHLYKIMEESVRRFNEMKKLMEEMNELSRYRNIPNVPVFCGTMEEKARKISQYTHQLCAAQYARMALGNIDLSDFERITADEAALTYYAMRGFVLFLEHVLLLANDEPGILNKPPTGDENADTIKKEAKKLQGQIKETLEN